MKLDIKPFSINKAFQGRRYKTPEYRCFADELRLLLKPMDIPDGPLVLDIIWGVSNMGSDTDNPCKPFQDVLSSHLGINDSRFHKIILEKIKTAKGEEFIDFMIIPYIPSERIECL